MYCHNCGHPLAGADPKFCVDCGTAVEGRTTPASGHEHPPACENPAAAPDVGAEVPVPNGVDVDAPPNHQPGGTPGSSMKASARPATQVESEDPPASDWLPSPGHDFATHGQGPNARPDPKDGQPKGRGKWVALGVVLAIVVVVVVMISTRSTPAVMPDVVGQGLDVAYTQLDSAGVNKADVEIVGGGTFGVIVESNWVVCFQTPSAGGTVENVELVVARECANLAEPDTGSATDTGTGVTPDAPSDSFVMPSVVGMVLQDAQDLLQSNGSYLMDQVDATGLGRIQVLDSNWKVCSQSPAAGASVTADQMVTLSAVKLDESC